MSSPPLPIATRHPIVSDLLAEAAVYRKRPAAGGAPTLDSIEVTLANQTWRPTASTDRRQMTATGHYSDTSTADLTTQVTWASTDTAVATISNGAGTEGQVTPLTVGPTTITATLGAVSGNTTLTLDVDVDSSGKGRPSTTFQFTMLGVTLYSAWLCQEASGNLAGFGPNAFTLTANGTPLYQQAPPSGWTATLAAFSQSVGQRFMAASGTGPNPASTSVLWIGYGCAQTAPSGVRGLLQIGGNIGTGIVNVTNALRISVVGTTTDETTTDPVADDLMHVMGVINDRTNARVAMFTDECLTAGTYNAGATDGNKGIGGNLFSASPPALCGFNFLFCLAGASAEMTDAQLKTLLQKLHWTINTGAGWP